MIKFVQVTYPFLLVWVAFTQRKIANLEESLSQADKNTEKNEHLLHPEISPDYYNSIETDIAKDESSKMFKVVNVLLDADASKEDEYNPSRETFYLATHKQRKRDMVDMHARKDVGNHERKVSRSLNRKQRKRKVYSADFNTKRTDLSHGRKLSDNNNTNTIYNTSTTCVLLNDSDSIDYAQDELNNSITTFDFTLDLMTDGYPEKTSWKLLPQNSNDAIIDSSDENATSSELMGSTLHKFEYRCVVSGEEKNEINNIQLENICYNFELHDSWGYGICCYWGLGYFSLSLNNSTTPIRSGRFYSSSLTSPFCLDNSNTPSENKSNTSSKYPSRECMNDVCICDSKPRLSNIEEDDEMFNTKFLTLNEIMMISDSKALADYESPQYKAACWVLHDDAFFHMNSFEIEKRKERMMQRYLLALFYFTTTPEKWNDHFHFLSSKSECEWTNDYDRGIICDEDRNVQIIYLGENNLEGTIVDELSELRTLEYLNLFNNNIQGTIPPTLGQLFELRYLDLGWNELEGTIPPTLGQLSELRYLDLGWNELEGTIPPTLGRLSELRYLDLGWNELEGTIPPQLFNATNLEELSLYDNELEGTIPETIGNLQKLSELSLRGNKLSGSIPDAAYKLENLEELWLDDNKLSSSISPLVGNLNKLQWLYLNNNMLTGQIPSTIGSLSSLNTLFLENNRLSGPIPESLFDLPFLDGLALQDNSVTGSVPDEFCESVWFIEADCRNDVFDSEVVCSCCTCKDESPIWDGKCADATIKVVIDHDFYDFFYNTFNFEWSLTNDATGKKVLHDGPYFHEIGLESYEECVAYSDRFSVNQISPPYYNTNYTIYWNDEPIHNGTFLGFEDNDDINIDDPLQTVLSFSYNEENQRLASCAEIEFICGEEERSINLKPNTTERIMYDQAIKISGKEIVNDPSSPQSKALCWLLQDFASFNARDENFETKFTQKYVLTLLHLSSLYPIFGSDKYPPSSHECQWQGLRCKGDSDSVTEISLENNQTIDGTLLQELGSLAFIEKLDLRRSKIRGTIPREFSNLWSLKEFNLSGNEISGTMPATLFRQLNKLEHIDLSHNIFSGSINKDIGSYSQIRTLLLRKNLLKGSIPLDGFKNYDLEHFDVSENELSGIDISLLLKHKNLKTLAISSNFFAGSLLEHTFISLSQLEYFNISQNDFSGTIPTTFPELSNITHLDIHDNRFRGTIPLGITELQSIKHLNVQGNKLTGSLPSQLNKLMSLDTLILSHNELKGLIPFEPTTLQNIQKLHLHSNKLSGKAPEFNNLTSYISDCGFPSDSLEPVTCSTCNTCCNSDGVCQSKTSEKLSQVQLTVIFVLTIIVLISMCYVMKDYITSNKYLKSFFSETVFFWNAMVLISDKSVYHFLLAKNKTEWFVAICCVVFQTATLFLFVHSADMSNSISDREYSMVCPANSLECEDSNSVSSYGKFIFGIILTIWLLKDIVGSIKLMLVSFQKRSIDFFFASAVIFTVTMLSIWTSVIYIIAIAVKNTDMIKDAVVLLFVVEIDERIFQLVETVNPDWIKAIDNNMRQSLIYGGDDLVITSWAQKSAKSIESMRQKMRERYESIRKRNSRRSGEREVDKDKEEAEKGHDENDVLPPP